MALKNGNGIKIAGFILTVVILVFGGGMAWSDIKNGMDTVQAAMVETKTEVAEAEAKQDEKIDQKVDQKDFDEVKTQVKETHDSVIRLEEQMETVNKNLDKILRKLDEH